MQINWELCRDDTTLIRAHPDHAPKISHDCGVNRRNIEFDVEQPQKIFMDRMCFTSAILEESRLDG